MKTRASLWGKAELLFGKNTLYKNAAKEFVQEKKGSAAQIKMAE